MTQTEFEQTIGRFDALEPTRSHFYSMALNLLNDGYEVEACLLILATWNFAYFRYILTKFDLGVFRKAIRVTEPAFRRLQRHTFETADFGSIAEDIEFVYGKFKELVGQTGASKLLHLKHPGLFVMWDTAIRTMWKIPQRALPEHYVRFLGRMKQEFGHIRWVRRKKTLAKAIDEYNFVEAHRKKRQGKKSATSRSN